MNYTITEKDGQILLKLARESILKRLHTPGGRTDPGLEAPSTGLSKKSGVFVTLHKKGKLRGCIGTIEPKQTIWGGVKENAVHAAFDDTRFAPLSSSETDEIDIEISILTPPEKIRYSDARDMVTQVIPFKDGVIIEKGHCRATFLPQVWDQLPNPEDFLSHLCTKAGLASGEWKKGDLTLYTYQVQSFAELDTPFAPQESK